MLQNILLFSKETANVLNLVDSIASLLFIVLTIVYFGVKIYHAYRKEKIAQENEVIDKIIYENIEIDKLINSPYIIKELYFRRFYSLRGFNTNEIEYFLSGFNPIISLYQIFKIKRHGILKFHQGKYLLNIQNLGKFSNLCIKHEKMYKPFLFFIFLILCIIFSFIIAVTKSIFLSFFLVIFLIFLEVILLDFSESITIYTKNKNDIDDMINNQSY